MAALSLMSPGALAGSMPPSEDQPLSLCPTRLSRISPEVFRRLYTGQFVSPVTICRVEEGPSGFMEFLAEVGREPSEEAEPRD